MSAVAAAGRWPAATKLPDFTVEQVKLHVEGEVWAAAEELAPSRAMVWTVRNTMLPLKVRSSSTATVNT